MRGALFENMLVAEYLKYLRHHGLAHGMFFWRDNTRQRDRLLIERAGDRWPVEMKSGATFQRDRLRGLHTWRVTLPRRGRGSLMLISAAPGHFVQEGVAGCIGVRRLGWCCRPAAVEPPGTGRTACAHRGTSFAPSTSPAPDERGHELLAVAERTRQRERLRTACRRCSARPGPGEVGVVAQVLLKRHCRARTSGHRGRRRASGPWPGKCPS